MTEHKPVTRVGIVGCGDILAAYMTGFQRLSRRVQVIRCGDLIVSRAEAAAAEFGIPRWGAVDELFADDDVDLVVSLTPPAVHTAIIEAAAAARKHIYTEKPLAPTTTKATLALAQAESSGVRLGAAPDTFLGSAGQTARAVIDRGEIGDPIGCVAFSPYSRAERWHPNPSFLFQPGAGPLLDTGPYFVAALVNLLGPVATVAGQTRVGRAPRRIPRPGGSVEEISVAVSTHATALLRFTSGAIGTLVTSFDIWDHRLPEIEIYGTEGTLAVPHPNWYDGEVKVKLHDDHDWRVVSPVLPPVQQKPHEKIRGLGVLDLAYSLENGSHRTSGELALHTLDVLEAVQLSSDQQDFIDMSSSCSRPAPLSIDEALAWFAQAQ